MLRSIASLLLLGPLVLGATSCSKDKDKETKPESPLLGEPVGAELKANGPVPSLSIALAVSKGQDPVPVLPKVVGAVSSAVSACPAFAIDEKETITALNFTVASGKLKVAPRPEPSPGLTCLMKALEGKDIGAAGPMDGRVEIKLSAAPKAP